MAQSARNCEESVQELIENGGDAKEVVEAKGLVQLSDPAQLLPMINEVLDNNQQSIDDFKTEKTVQLVSLLDKL